MPAEAAICGTADDDAPRALFGSHPNQGRDGVCVEMNALRLPRLRTPGLPGHAVDGSGRAGMGKLRDVPHHRVAERDVSLQVLWPINSPEHIEIRILSPKQRKVKRVTGERLN